MSIEGVANTEYASLSGKIHTMVVDKTLSISGACADAKATGDAIEKVEGGIDAANEALEEAKAAYDKAVEDMEETAKEVAETAVEESMGAVEEKVAKAMPKVSMNAPTSTDNIEAGYAIGQTWLRPNYTLTNLAYNKAAEDFVATACVATKAGQTFTFAGNGDDKVISAELNHGSANGWLYCVVTPDATAATANLVVGGETVALTVGEANTIQRRYTGESIKFEATYETANAAAAGTITVENLTIIDEAATLAQVDEICRDIADETVFSFVFGYPPNLYWDINDAVSIPSAEWTHIGDGVWKIAIEENVRNIWDYCWRRRGVKYTLTQGGEQTGQIIYVYKTGRDSQSKITYSDSVTVDATGKLALSNPAEVNVSYNGFSEETAALLRGKYVLNAGQIYTFNNSYLNYDSIRFVPADAAYTKTSSGDTHYGVLIDSCALGLTQDARGDWQHIFSSDIDEHSHTAGAKELNQCVGKLEGYEYEFFGSIVKNSMAYYKLNAEAVLNALLGLEG